MFEKVNPCHPDKVADRIAGAIVDLCYTKSRDPKVACEVLIGHGECNIQVETSEQISAEDIGAIVSHIAGEGIETRALIVPQDIHLAANQQHGVKCGDNGIFRGVPPTYEQRVLTDMANFMYKRFPYDGKYIIEMDVEPGKSMAEMDCERLKERYKELRREEQAAETDKDKKRLHKKAEGVLHNLYALQSLGHPAFTICQSHATWQDVRDAFNDFAKSKEDYEYPLFYSQTTINPLGEWTGGPNTDSGATNRKLGSDMGEGVTGGGLHGKDLSKADVSVNIWCYLESIRTGHEVTACCSIGDESVGGVPYAEIVEQARLYIHTLGGFEKFAEWGLIRALEHE